MPTLASRLHSVSGLVLALGRFGLLVLLLSLPAAAPAFAQPAPARAAAAAPQRTPAQVEALIAEAGRTPPDWFAATNLNYPKTLDLTWAKPAAKEWNSQKNMGQYLWDIIYPNPGRWREGVKLVHHTLQFVEDDPQKFVSATMGLGRLYGECLGDFARAAFWYRAAGADKDTLAVCYWRLGCKDLAVKALREYGADDTRNGTVIKLWADMGELDTALKLAEAKAKEDDNPDAAFLAAGDACRLAGKYPQALAYYQKVLALKQGIRDFKRNQARAQASIDAIKAFDALDLKRIPDGKYTSSSLGYAAPVQVEVAVKAGRIEAVRVTQHKEKQFYSAMIDTTKAIVDRQGVKGVDVTTGATITSEAIINAAAKALAGGMK